MSADDGNEGALGRMVRQGRDAVQGAVSSGRTLLKVRALQSDLDHFWIRLGKTAFRLVESGEINHPGLEKAVARIHELEAEIARLTRATDEG